MPICIKCEENKDFKDFYFKKKTQKFINTCNECERKRSKERYKGSSFNYYLNYRIKNKEKICNQVSKLRELNKKEYEITRKIKYNDLKEKGLDYQYNRYQKEPYKKQANDTLKYHLNKNNIVKPIKCNKCNEYKKLVGHHESYLKKDRLNVEWLCSSCHRKYHVDYDITIILLEIKDIIYPYEDNLENTNIFSKAVINFPQRNLNNCLNEMEINIFKLVFKYLEETKLNIIKSEYGKLTEELFGISTIVFKV